MQFKRKLTEVAVDSLTEYLQERFERLRQFDLDQDGQKDLDQIVALLGNVGSKAKETLASTDIANIAAGLDQMIQGATLIQKSFDQEKVTEFFKEVATVSAKLSHLAELSIAYVKEHGKTGGN
jgi:hypothetical protein